MIDGLGHGPEAAQVARVARAVLAQSPQLDCVATLQACHQALGGTRGAVISLAWIDAAGTKLTFAGVGNVCGRLIEPTGTRQFAANRGILGAVYPKVIPVVIDLPADWRFVLHSDGISERFKLDFYDIAALAPADLAQQILADWANPSDDASVLVAMPVR